METKHTAGQWNPEYNRVISSFNILKDGDIIAAINDDGTKEFEEVEANAKLIAAAPELLEMCIATLEDLESGELTGNATEDALINLRAAIKAATT